MLKPWNARLILRNKAGCKLGSEPFMLAIIRASPNLVKPSFNQKHSCKAQRMCEHTSNSAEMSCIWKTQKARSQNSQVTQLWFVHKLPNQLWVISWATTSASERSPAKRVGVTKVKPWDATSKPSRTLGIPYLFQIPNVMKSLTFQKIWSCYKLRVLLVRVAPFGTWLLRQATRIFHAAIRKGRRQDKQVVDAPHIFTEQFFANCQKLLSVWKFLSKAAKPCGYTFGRIQQGAWILYEINRSTCVWMQENIGKLETRLRPSLGPYGESWAVSNF